MRPQLQAIAASQGGVFFRHQAITCGYTDDEIRRLKRTQQWLVVRHGAYVDRDLAPAQDDRAGWHRLRTLAVLHRVDAPAVATHSSAATLLSLPQWDTDLSTVYLTRDRHHAARNEAGVAHRDATLPESQVTCVDGVACSDGARTAWDIAREFGFEAGVVTADAVLRLGADRARRPAEEAGVLPRRGATRHDLDRLAEAMADWPRARTAVEAFSFADGGAESVGESLARMFVVSLGFPAPRTQVVIESAGFIARVDMLIEALDWVLEFDGRLKYRRTRDDCDPVVDDGDIVWAEKIREDGLRGAGKHVSRVIWTDMFGARRRVAGAALWRTAERLGAPEDWQRPSWLRAA
jgi:hypothetical protein